MGSRSKRMVQLAKSEQEFSTSVLASENTAIIHKNTSVLLPATAGREEISPFSLVDNMPEISQVTENSTIACNTESENASVLLPTIAVIKKITQVSQDGNMQEIPQGVENSTIASHAESGSASSDSSSTDSSDSSSEDCDDLLGDRTYEQKSREQSEDSDEEERISSAGSLDTESQNKEIIVRDLNVGENQDEVIPDKRGRKRKRDESKWKRNVTKKARNSGKKYETHTRTKKMRKERQIQPACTEKCKLKCASKFTKEDRVAQFSAFWGLGDVEKQRQFISNSMQEIHPQYRYVRIGGTRTQRQNNNAFYFVKNKQRIHVCKLFFKNTLDINDRPIRTVVAKRNKCANVLLEEDQRGKHGKQKAIDDNIKQGIKSFIESIPKIESHYLRANTSKHFIDGSKSIASIHKDYVTDCREKMVPFGNYTLFYRIFTTEFNISFFVPKKDQCETCCAFENAVGHEKEELKKYYDQHLIEKDLTRKEKQIDKEKTNALVAVYDLEAVVQLPKGDVSVFYYKSKLNVLNFTIFNLNTHFCDCYLWDESNGNRGVNELGTCVLKYLTLQLSLKQYEEVIFFSDNCTGQQKNKFMIALYIYAVRCLGIKKITHKFLIKGHTQNEGDSAHSLIERKMKKQLKAGPMYPPESFASVIRGARVKPQPFHVHELCYEDFHDIKQLHADLGPLTMTNNVKLGEVKVLEIRKECPNTLFYKTSYEDEEFKQALVIKKKKFAEVVLQPAFIHKPRISDQKKKDLMELVQKKHIPNYYKTFYESL